MTEAVDRLELVADREDVRQIGMRDEIDELALEAVRVLELVHHDHPEAELRLLPDGVVVAQEVPGSQLQVLEVDDRFAPLRSGILGGEAFEQLLQELAVVGCELLEGGALRRLAGCSKDAARAPLEARAERSTTRSGSEPGVATRSASPAFRRWVAVADSSPASCSASARSAVIALSRLCRCPSSRTSSRPDERSVS